jgi:hypothetical protein
MDSQRRRARQVCTLSYGDVLSRPVLAVRGSLTTVEW